MIVTGFFFFLHFFVLIFYLVLFILAFIVAQLFIIFAANVETAWFAVGLISIVFKIVPYNVSWDDCFKSSFYDLLIAIYVIGNNSSNLCLLYFANDWKYCSIVWFFRFIYPFVCGWNGWYFVFIFNVFRNFVLNFDMNNLFLSLMIYSKMLCFVNISFKNNFVYFFAVIKVLQKTNFA